MDEFVIEKYIEKSIDISISIAHADPDPHSYNFTIQYNRRSYDSTSVNFW